ncbi:MAG: hypothetical protein GWN58_47600, partial [Anaerolineae bacterium]|nr:hypothetical protein [Anaerolineae bacterium]
RFASPKAWHFAGSLLAGIVGRFRKGTDHGLAGTVLEEMYRQLYAGKLGINRWDEVKRNIRDAYTFNPAHRPEDSFHGGVLFIDQLKQYLDQRSTLQVHLVGCGSGSVHVCHFVERAAQVLGAGFQFENIVLLAPAANFDTFQSGIVDHADRIANLHIFAMADEYERRDPLLKPAPLLYPHSLLYLISGLFEAEPDTPLVGLARHHHDERFLQYRKQLSAQVVYSITADDAPPGQRAQFTSHHGKASSPSYDQSTLESIALLVRPKPEEEPQSFSLEITPEIKRLLEPEAAEAAARRRLLDWLPWRRPQPELRPRDILDESEIVYHETLAGLIKAGRSVARILTPGIEGLSKIPPEDREAHWQQAKDSHQITEGWHGTGWILGQARRVLVTNNHVLPLRQAALGAVAQFGYETGSGTSAKPRYVRSFSPGDLFFTSPNHRFGGLDYTAVALSEPATQETGYLEP